MKPKPPAEGRPIFEDVEMCRDALSRLQELVSVFPAHGFSHWMIDPETGEQGKVTYAERFQHQYQQFKEHAAQTKTGTPLEYATVPDRGAPRRAARAEHLHRRGAGRDRRRRS